MEEESHDGIELEIREHTDADYFPEECPFCGGQDIRRHTYKMREVQDLGSPMICRRIYYERVYFICKRCKKIFSIEPPLIPVGFRYIPSVIEYALSRILNKPLLFYLVERLKLVKTPNKFIIATGLAELNKKIIDFAKKFNLNYFMGSENDVLDRYYKTSKKFNGDIIVRITSDCPLMDPNLIDDGLEMFLTMKYEYVSNAHPPTYPDGYDIEIFSFKKLENAWKKAILPSEREHVTPYIWKNIDKSKMGNFEHDVDLSKFRLTVDTHKKIFS